MTNTFEKLLVDLSRNGVDYILVGGLAVALCGYVRATLDVDILVEASPENINHMLTSLQSFGEGAAKELTLEDFPIEEGAVRIIEDFPLDIFTQMSGYTYDDLIAHTDAHEVQKTTINYLNAKGLLLLKSDSLRPKDQLDVIALKEIQRTQQRG